MKDIKELQNYVEKTGDSQFRYLLILSKKNTAKEIPTIIRTIKDKHVAK